MLVIPVFAEPPGLLQGFGGVSDQESIINKASGMGKLVNVPMRFIREQTGRKDARLLTDLPSIFIQEPGLTRVLFMA